jgi:1-acyl-sn-glycerol-3-phosphate acyltransferase
MRALRYLVALGAVTFWCGGHVILLALLGVRHRPGGAYDRVQRRWARLLLKVTGIRVATTGAESLPQRPLVFISNHASFVDIWALLATLPGSLRFVFKKEFLYFPVMGLAMRAMGHIAIDRGKRSAAFASYDRAASAVRGGISPIVFAEGTRSRTGKLMTFKKGPFVLAIAAGAPVVPVFCAETFARLPKGSFSPRPGGVQVRIGTPIATEGLGYDDRDQLSARTREALLELGAVE